MPSASGIGFVDYVLWKYQGGRRANEQHGPSCRPQCTVESIEKADPAQVTSADAVCVGSWTKGLFVIRQGPTPATMSFSERLGSLDGKPAAVFTTYDIAIGNTLRKMATPLEARGANVTGEFKSKGPHAAEGSMPGCRPWTRGGGALRGRRTEPQGTERCGPPVRLHPSIRI